MLRRLAHGYLKVLARRVFASHDEGTGKRHRKWALQQIREQAVELKRRYARKKKTWQVAVSRQEYSRDMLLLPIASNQITTDAELLVDASVRVLSRDTYEEILRMDQEARAERERLAGAAEQDRSDLLRRETCEELEQGA